MKLDGESAKIFSFTIFREQNLQTSITIDETVEQLNPKTAITTASSTGDTVQSISKTVRKEVRIQGSWWGIGYIRTVTIRTLGPDSTDQDHVDIYTERRICPAPWTRAKGLTICQGLENGNWKYWFKPGHIVPDSAELFQACMFGDLEKVVSLVAEGVASVHDTTQSGMTPLHVRLSR